MKPNVGVDDAGATVETDEGEDCVMMEADEMETVEEATGLEAGAETDADADAAAVADVSLEGTELLSS